MSALLLVEDDYELLQHLVDFLRTEGFVIAVASGRNEALKQLEGGGINLVLLDIALSDGNGFSFCKEIKLLYRLPVVFLTASGDEYSTVTGLELGADDYISKPFRPRELVSRIKNVLRRVEHNGTVRVGGIEVDTIRGTARCDGNDLYLSPLEYRLLLTFINNRGILLTRGHLLSELWDPAGEFVSDNTLSVCIRRLREKLGDSTDNPSIITTVRGVGYRLD
jgi:Response regulators consisting of a CheY-like receiver domain and a winged-helix DNA-binding domain